MVKHTFAILNSTSNPLWGAFLEVSEATNGSLGVGLLVLFFVVSTFVFIRRTQDVGKSLASSLHVVVILGLLLYYGGKVSGYVVISDVLMLGLIVAEVLTVAGLYYFRTNKD